MELIFPFSHIALTAGIMAVVSLLLLFGARPFFKIRSPVEILLIPELLPSIQQQLAPL